MMPSPDELANVTANAPPDTEETEEDVLASKRFASSRAWGATSGNTAFPGLVGGSWDCS